MKSGLVRRFAVPAPFPVCIVPILWRSSGRMLMLNKNVWLVMAGVLCFGCAIINPKPVLILVRIDSINLDLSLEQELGVIVDSLDRYRMKYKIATLDGGQISAGGKIISADQKFSDVRVQDYRAIIVPCMGSGRFPVPPDMVAVLKAAYNEKLFIAAQHSEEIFKPAALGLYVGTSKSPGVVVDGKFITSYNSPTAAQINHKPCDTGNLILTLYNALK